MSFLKAVGVDNQMWQGSGISQPHATNLSLLIFMLSTLAVAASTNIVAYIYRKAGDQGDDDDFMATRRLVYRHLPDAFFRLFVTDLWAFVAFSMVAIACAVFASILNVVLRVMNSGGPYSRHNQTSFFPLAAFAFVIAMNTVFALAASIAALEPEKYGRAALRQSMTYVERRPLTIFGVVVLSMAIGGLFSDPLPTVVKADSSMPLLEKITAATLFSILSFVVNAYLGIAAAVMYFACISNFDESVPPEFQRGSNTISTSDNPHKRIVPGSSLVP